MINFEYIRVSTVQAALDAYRKNPGSSYIAGGTNLVDLMKKNVTAPQRLIDINPLPLKEVTQANGIVKIGALVPNSDLAANDIIRKNYPLLSLALEAGASAQLRNMATVGGNMLQRTRCSYFYDSTMPCNKRNPGTGCGALKGINRMHAIFGASEQCIAVHPSDMCVALAALEAKVELQGPAGNRSIPFSQFHRLPEQNAALDNTLRAGELITAITLPAPAFTKNVYYLKVRDRASYAFALVSAAVAFRMENNVIREAKIALGGVAHKPWRLTAVENFLKGKEAGETTFSQAAAMATKGARAYEHNQFKLKLAPATLEEAMHKAAEGIQL